MKKFAVIDIGSNSVRLLFVADGTILYKNLNTTRLGEGLTLAPYLLEAPTERTAQAVAAFYRQAIDQGAEGVFAFATAAVRTAKNRAVFLDRVRSLCGLEIEVLSGEEEAEIGIIGALGTVDGGVIDIGGASTEIVARKNGELVYKKSLNIGVVRLKESCGRSLSALKERASEVCREFGALPSLNYYAIGGTATTLAAQCLGLQAYSSALVTGTKITVEEMGRLRDQFAAMSVEEIALLPCMPTGRADVILGGAQLLTSIMEELGIPQITVSDRDNLEGYAIKRGLMKT